MPGTRGRPRRCSVYWLYWYKSTNTDADGGARCALSAATVRRRSFSVHAQFTCFTGTKVPILTQKAVRQVRIVGCEAGAAQFLHAEGLALLVQLWQVFEALRY